MVKCKQMPVEDTLADAEFINLMEEGGPFNMIQCVDRGNSMI